MTVKRGEAEGIVVSLGTEISLPQSLLDKLGWKIGDKIDLTETEICFDWGEVDGLVMRNLTKEKAE